MNRSNRRIIVVIGTAILVSCAAWIIVSTHSPKPVPSGPAKAIAPTKPFAVTIDYPADASIFPPEFPPPTFLWRDAAEGIDFWEIAVSFDNGTLPLRAESEGAKLRLNEMDPRAVSPTNEPPALTLEQAAAHTWTPDAEAWSVIKKNSVEHPAKIVITGRRRDTPGSVFSRGQVSIQTSKDEVGAPIFYRDVPLMPSENEKGVIKPLAPQAIPLIAWRLRDVGENKSRLLMQGLHTCANCHSFSKDGKTLGMDMDGPHNDKGLYAVVDTAPHMSIRNEDLIEWSTFRGKLGSRLRVGFMSQISPDAKYVITTINDPGIDQTDYQRRKDPIDLVRNYYVANFKDYRFLQVFYPTRGLLAWYSRDNAHLTYLSGADDPRFVHANAVWSPDGKSLVFARAEAKDAYPEGKNKATFANDPNETQIKFDLYRIPFNEGKGGKPEPVPGASQNGMSNSFPKISPDGRWIVFVQSKNGLLMRPDGKLHIVPAGGGTARLMKCNTPLMNSWHSFSPNGRWMVFSSKSRSPYTDMFLTHIDEEGNDSPAILIDNTKASNRAINIPEFVNIEKNGMMKIDAPAADYALHIDLATELMKSGKYADAVPEWNQAIALAPKEWRTHNSLGVALMEIGKVDEAIAQYREALTLNPQYAEAFNNLGEALSKKGAVDEAIAMFEKAVETEPKYAVAHANLGMILARTGKSKDAIEHLKMAAEATPDSADAHRNLGHALAETGDLKEAIVQLKLAVDLSGGRDPLALHLLGRVLADSGKISEAVEVDRRALEIASKQNNAGLIQAVQTHLLELLSQR